eukprot:scaffold90054_cov75-Phaeocystis_antarctica.AAC.1
MHRRHATSLGRSKDSRYSTAPSCNSCAFASSHRKLRDLGPSAGFQTDCRRVTPSRTRCARLSGASGCEDLQLCPQPASGRRMLHGSEDLRQLPQLGYDQGSRQSTDARGPSYHHWGQSQAGWRCAQTSSSRNRLGSARRG